MKKIFKSILKYFIIVTRGEEKCDHHIYKIKYMLIFYDVRLTLSTEIDTFN